MKRYLYEIADKMVSKKMLFIAGPRQCGKTTLSLSLLNPDDKDRWYFNWDDDTDRERILKKEFPMGSGRLVLDEIHKYKNWRNLLKGLYDKNRDRLEMLVTGSAKLDYYRRGGDSLQGRYNLLRMHPLSLAELGGGDDALRELMAYGPFPEPFFSKSTTDARVWSRQYRSRLVREELTQLEKVNEVSLLEEMVLRLPDLVGSPLSINSLREDLRISHQTASRWLEFLERLYSIFRIYPFGSLQLRALKKEAKHYHYDWNLVQDEGKRFENLIACHLLKWCHFIEDTEGHDMQLRFFRDVDHREVDFVVIKDSRPILFVEAKLSGGQSTTSLRYLNKKFPKVPCYCVSLKDSREYETDDGIRVCKASTLLEGLV